MYIAFVLWLPSDQIILTSEVFNTRMQALAWVATQQLTNEEFYEPEDIQNFGYTVAKVGKITR